MTVENNSAYIDEVVAVIVGAGSGERLREKRPKAFVGLDGRVILEHSLQAFEEHEGVDSIVLVVPEDWVGPAEVLVDDFGCDKVASIEIGDSCRAGSVRNGLEAVAIRDETAVLVHDAARPIVPSTLIDRLIDPFADGWDCVVPVLPVFDTIKTIDPSSNKITSTLDREILRAAQTPQASRSSVLKQAYQNISDKDLQAATDCASLIAKVTDKITYCDGDIRTMKITTPADLKRVEEMLKHG